MTAANRNNYDLIDKLRKKYLKLRILTEEEEVTAGKFSQLGKKLGTVRKDLSKKLGRDPTDEEWAIACKMTVEELIMYINLSTQAKNRLVQHNIRMVDHWARRLIEHSNIGKDVSYYELVAEGLVGLTKAAESFQVGKARFYTHAEVYVRSELYKGLTKLRPGTHTPHRVMMVNAKLHKAQNYLKYTLKRNPTDEELGKFVNMKVDVIRSVRREAKLKVMSDSLSRDSGKNSDDSSDGSTSYFDLGMKSNPETSHLENLFWKVEFNSALDILSPAEKRTISIRFGLMDGRPRSVETTAELMSESSEQTRRTIIKAMEKLKNSEFSEMLQSGPASGMLLDSSALSNAADKFVHMY
jgi:RNA polymerase sigma factor (sigma-70 family)